MVPDTFLSFEPTTRIYRAISQVAGSAAARAVSKVGRRIVFLRADEQFIDGLPGVTVAEAQANLAARHT